MIGPGRQLGKYHILEKLGAGGMADVWLAEDTSLKRQVALKILPPEFARDPERAARFEKEVLSSASLQHPGIVTIHDVGHEQGVHYYTMTLLPGGDLKQKIRAGLSPQQALKLLRQMADALDHAHGKGFVHRDLKPENIMFDGREQPVITDFGIAKAVGSGTKMTGTGMSIGTPHYMSPEQAQGLADIDGRSDLYSLGIILYEMLTGQVPFDADNTVGIAMQHVQAPLPRLPQNLGKLQPLLDRLLAKDPGQRYANASELCAAIDAVLSGQTLPEVPRIAPPASSPVAHTQVMQTEKSAPVGKGGGLKWAIGGALLAVLVVGGFLLMNGGMGKKPVFAGGGGAVTPVSRLKAAPTKAVAPARLAQGDAILQVTSKPKGAMVYLDGVKLGATPLTRSDLPAGKHQMKLELEYYQPSEQPIQLGSAEVVKEHIRLQRGKGKITVLSDPSGTRVYLDGKKQKETTPLTLSAITAGPHTLKLHKDKYYDAEESVEVLHQQTAKLEVRLKGGNLVKYAGNWLEPEEAAKQKAAAEAARQKAAAEAARKAEAAKRARFETLVETGQQALERIDRELAISKFQNALKLYPQDTNVKKQLYKAEALIVYNFTDPATGMEFVLVKGSCYQMGSNDGYDNEKPVHEVCIDDFYMGKYEVTQGEYEKITGDNPSEFKGRNRPVEMVSWYDAQAYIGKLNNRSNKRYRLPTEAEWEYAARSGGKHETWAGTSSKSSLGDYAWYSSNSGGKTHEVGQKRPNGQGLYDMSGNVWEWVSDYYDSSYYSKSPRNNPQGPSSGSIRVFRGGSWNYNPDYVRAANRGGFGAAARGGFLGFRLVSSGQ